MQPDRSEAGQPRLGYVPSLDGIRAIAVVAVLCFHQGFGWARGGYLGVSLFFTLSGYLITRLLLTEYRSRRSISLGAFWMRRLRRLGPALLLTLVGVVVISGFLRAQERVGLQGDILAALGYVANWHFLLQGHGYADLFASPSLLQHFWSLAIEEQFYLVYPALLFMILAVSRGSRRVLVASLSLLAAASLTIAITASSADRVYFGTDTRALELLAGALLALAIGRDARRATLIRAAMGLAGLVSLGWLWSQVPVSSVWLYHGGFGLIALVNVAVLTGAVTPGPVMSVLRLPVLQRLGKISYGVYLYHWPVFLLLSTERVHLTSWPLFVLRVGVVLALASASYVFVELPIRAGRFFRPPVFAGAMVSSAALVALLAMVVVVPSRGNDVITSRDFRRVTAATLPSPSATPVSLPAGLVPHPLRVVIFGDSTGVTAGNGWWEWGVHTGKALVENDSHIACGLLRGAELRSVDFAFTDEGRAGCDQWPTRWPAEIQRAAPDVIVVFMGPANTVDAKVPGDDTWRGLSDPKVDGLLWSQMQAAASVLQTSGVPVLWFDSPPVDQSAAGLGSQADPFRMARYNQLVERLVADRPFMARIGWTLRVKLLTDDARARLRPDGAHPQTQAFESMLDAGLWDEVVRAYVHTRLNMQPGQMNAATAKATARGGS